MNTTMNQVQFNFAVRPTVIQSDRDRLNIEELDNGGLRRIAKGKIFLTIEKPREFAVIDSEVLDYLMQLRGVVDQIDSGNHETFAVSGDYFSNNLRFTYEPASRKLEIYEVNGGSFKIGVPYRDFRSALLIFYKQALSDFQILYPELTRNEEFCAMQSRL